MTHSSKRKGNGFERELVSDAQASGLTSKRAYASNGESLGCAAEVDLQVEDWRLQAKRRKAIASYLQVPEGCDAVVFRQDRGEPMVLLSWYDFLDLVKGAK